MSPEKSVALFVFHKIVYNFGVTKNHNNIFLMKKITSLLLLILTFQVSYSQQTETIYLSGKGTDDAVMWDFYCTAGRNNGK